MERLQDSQVKWILCDSNRVEMCLKLTASVDWKVHVICSTENENPKSLSVSEYFTDDGSRNVQILLFLEMFFNKLL